MPILHLQYVPPPVTVFSPVSIVSAPPCIGDPWSPETSNVDYNAHVPGGPAEHGFDYSFIIPSSLDIVPYCYIRNGSLIAPGETVNLFDKKPDITRDLLKQLDDIRSERTHI